MSCKCVCHASSGTFKLRCSIDRESSGVPGLPSCSPCAYSSTQDDGDGPAGSKLTCINGCTDKPADDDHKLVPRLATRGRLCSGCARKLTGWLKDIPVDFALLEMLKAPSGSQRMDGTSRTKQAEAPAPVRLDVVALIDDGRAGAARDPGDELWYELPDIPSPLNVVHTWAEQLRNDLDPSREAA